MSQPLHTGPKIIDGCLLADWLQQPEPCDECDGTGHLTFRADGILFELDEPCPECGGDRR